jgi:hypothetical protein
MDATKLAELTGPERAAIFVDLIGKVYPGVTSLEPVVRKDLGITKATYYAYKKDNAPVVVLLLLHEWAGQARRRDIEAWGKLADSLADLTAQLRDLARASENALKQTDESALRAGRVSRPLSAE